VGYSLTIHSPSPAYSIGGSSSAVFRAGFEGRSASANTNTSVGRSMSPSRFHA
jgi:hypothetical protein